MEQITTIGLDIAKHVFHVHAVISRRASRPRELAWRSPGRCFQDPGTEVIMRCCVCPLSICGRP
jgi:hypothetical protein